MIKAKIHLWLKVEVPFICYLLKLKIENRITLIYRYTDLYSDR